MNVRNITLGVYGGLAGGVVFGALMALMGMLPMIGMMVGVPSAVVGFLVHLVISALIGISFAVLFDPLSRQCKQWVDLWPHLWRGLVVSRTADVDATDDGNGPELECRRSIPNASQPGGSPRLWCHSGNQLCMAQKPWSRMPENLYKLRARPGRALTEVLRRGVRPWRPYKLLIKQGLWAHSRAPLQSGHYDNQGSGELPGTDLDLQRDILSTIKAGAIDVFTHIVKRISG